MQFNIGHRATAARFLTCVLVFCCMLTAFNAAILVSTAQTTTKAQPTRSVSQTKAKPTMTPRPANSTSCNPGNLSAQTGLPSNSGTWTANFSYTSTGFPGCFIGVIPISSNVNWLQFVAGSSSCSPNPAPILTLVQCTIRYTVQSNTASGRQATITMDYGSAGQQHYNVFQYGPVENLNVSVIGSGSISELEYGRTCTISCTPLVGVYYGYTDTLTATPSTGYSFTGWSGACSGTGRCTLLMTSDKNVTATFTPLPPVTLTVNVTPNANGTVTSSPSGISCSSSNCTASFPNSSNVTLSQTPASGYAFTGWSGACSGTGSSCVVSMTAARTVTANYAPLEALTVNVTPSASGTVTSSPSGISCTGGNCTAQFAQNTNVTLTSSPAVGYSFVGWSGACSGTGTCIVAVSTALTVTATYAPSETLTVSVTPNTAGTVMSSPSGIACTGSNCNAPFAQNTHVTLTETPASGYAFTGWSGGGCSGTSSTCIVTMSAATNVTATFVLTDAVTVVVSGSGSVSSGPSGITCPGVCTANFPEPSQIELYATPVTGYTVTWSGEICIAGSNLPYECIVRLSGTNSRTITATYTPVYQLTVHNFGGEIDAVYINPGGYMCPDSGSTCTPTFAPGTVVTLSANSENYTLMGWTGACSGTNSSCQVTMTQNMAVGAKFSGPAVNINTVAGDNYQGFSGDGGSPTLAELNLPQGLTVDGIGHIFIADTGNYRIRKVTGGAISTVAGNGTSGYSGDNGPATSAELGKPVSVAINSGENKLYIADQSNNSIRMVSISAGVAGNIITVAGNGTAGYSGDGGLATNAEINQPSGVAMDNSGNILIADTANNRIRMITASTGVITTIAGNGTAGFSGDGGAATSAQLNGPVAIAVDGSGNIYVADSGNYRVRMVTTAGVISTFAGNGTTSYSGDNGLATNAGFASVTGVAVNPYALPPADVYIADATNNRVRIVPGFAVFNEYQAGYIYTAAGNGTAGFAGDGGAAVNSELNQPWGVGTDPSGHLVIADKNNNRIRSF